MKKKETTSAEPAGLAYLFLTFLKIGAMSFGGHMALVAVIQKILVDRDKVLSTDTIINGISVASFLPGPLAVNMVAYTGYALKGRKGAAVSLAGIILPSFLLMLVLARAYFAYAHKIHLDLVMQYTLGAVCAIILSTGVQLFKKEVAGAPIRLSICVVTVLVSLCVTNYFATIGLLAAGALTGYLFERQKTGDGGLKTVSSFNLPPAAKYIIGVLSLLEALFLTNGWRFFSNIYLKLATVFSGMSLNLFGGGYVMIPFMQSLFVDGLRWLSQKEFADAIAFSQVTPGPILISAAFIGFKMAGVAGAVIATAGIFVPSAVLMILVSKLVLQYKDRPELKKALAGIKAAVIGLIIAAALKMLPPAFSGLLPALVTLSVFFLSFTYKISPVYLILGSVITGIIVLLINQQV